MVRRSRVGRPLCRRRVRPHRLRSSDRARGSETGRCCLCPPGRRSIGSSTCAAQRPRGYPILCPACSTAAGAAPDPTFPGYFALFESIIRGIRNYERDLPTSVGPARLVYFDNLAWDGRDLREIEKPFTRYDFSTYDRYRAFLDTTLRRMTENLAARERRYPVSLVGDDVLGLRLADDRGIGETDGAWTRPFPLPRRAAVVRTAGRRSRASSASR